MMNRVTGNMSQEEARRRQFSNYQKDQQKHTEKEKEKLDKKKQDKWKRYEHIDTGMKLSDFGISEEAARARQRSIQQDTIMNHFRVERENPRLRTETERRHESLQAATCSSAISGVNHARIRPSVVRAPFVLNSVANSPSLASSSVSSPRSPIRKPSPRVFEDDSTHLSLLKSPKINVDSDSVATREESQNEEMKREMHKRRMESVRENMQKLYTQNLNKEN